METGYEGGGRRRDTWWRQEAPETQLRATLEDMSREAKRRGRGERHRWELPGNYPVFTVVMVIYHYVERIWRILVIPDFS